MFLIITMYGRNHLELQRFRKNEIKNSTISKFAFWLKLFQILPITDNFKMSYRRMNTVIILNTIFTLLSFETMMKSTLGSVKEIRESDYDIRLPKYCLLIYLLSSSLLVYYCIFNSFQISCLYYKISNIQKKLEFYQFSQSKNKYIHHYMPHYFILCVFFCFCSVTVRSLFLTKSFLSFVVNYTIFLSSYIRYSLCIEVYCFLLYVIQYLVRLLNKIVSISSCELNNTNTNNLEDALYLIHKCHSLGHRVNNLFEFLIILGFLISCAVIMNCLYYYYLILNNYLKCPIKGSGYPVLFWTCGTALVLLRFILTSDYTINQVILGNILYFKSARYLELCC